MDLEAICEHDYLSIVSDIEGRYNKNLKIDFKIIKFFWMIKYFLIKNILNKKYIKSF